MSTRSNIYLKLKNESKGQTIKFDFRKLPRLHGEQHAQLEFPIKDVTIPENAEYLCVYHHWDGYITGVGNTLQNTYTDYDTILNLLAMGDLSTINGGVTSYQGWRNENCPVRFVDKDTKFSHWVSYKTPKTKKVKDAFGTHEEKVYGHYVKRPMIKKDGTLNSKNALLEEYAYLFDGEKWWVTYFTYDEEKEKYVHHDWVELAPILEKEMKAEERVNA